jgi:peptidylprolyl isomerase
MRMVSRFLTVLVVTVLASSVTACVSRVGAGPAPTPTIEPLPTSGAAAAECGTADITVTGALTEKPKVTLPTGCAAPTSLLALDLETGHGPAAVAGSNLVVGYVMVAWSDGSVLDSTWSGNDNLPLPVKNLGHADVINGWNLGLPGIREGGRRLIVVPPEMGYGQAGNAQVAPMDTLVYVLDAVEVAGR